MTKFVITKSLVNESGHFIGEIPDGITEIGVASDCYGHLESLPENLPQSLQTLDLSNCYGNAPQI